MTSVILRSDGRLGFGCGDRTSFGHEVAEHVQAGRRSDARVAAKRLQRALSNLMDDAAPLGLAQEIDQLYRNEPFHDVGKSVLSWLTGASTGEVQEFCVASAAAYARQSERLRAAEPLLDADVAMRAARLRAIGYLPVAAATAYEQTAARIRRPLRYIDFFESGATGAVGSYWPVTRTIALQPRYLSDETPSQVMYRGNFHEHTHAVGHDRGSFMQWRSRGQGYRWLEEAFVEHTLQMSEAEAERPDTFNPIARMDYYVAVYAAEREFLHLAARMGKATVGAIDLAHAFFSPRGTAVKLRRQVFSRLDRNIRQLVTDYAEGGLRAFSAEYEGFSDKRARTTWLLGHNDATWERLEAEQYGPA